MTLHGTIGLLVTVALTLGGCPKPEPCLCPEAPDAPAAPTVAPPAPAPVDPPGALPGAGRLHPSGPEAQLALDVATALFSERAPEAFGRFNANLEANLSLARLEKIVAAVVSAHGPPVEVMDAWLGQVEEEGRTLRAAQVLLRMANEVRFRLLLIIDRNGDIDGLWLRPI